MKRFTIMNVNAKSNKKAWLELRRQHLTATDWPKITGTSRWGNADDVVADKRSYDYTGDFTPSFPMRVGTALEPLIAERVMEWMEPGEYLSQDFICRKHLGFTPDLLRIDSSSNLELVEIKVSVKDWNDEVPPDYMDQVKFQATVLGIDQVQIVHLKLPNWPEGFSIARSGNLPEEGLSVYVVDIDEAERGRVERKAERWWKENIERG